MHHAYNIAEAYVALHVRDWGAQQFTAVSTECRKSHSYSTFRIHIELKAVASRS